MPLDQTDWPIVEVDETTALLIRARAFLERGWCRYALAMDCFGPTIFPTSEQAVSWCMIGALIAAGWNSADYRHPAIRLLQTAIGDKNIVGFNNRWETVEPILAAFDRAIAMGG